MQMLEVWAGGQAPHHLRFHNLIRSVITDNRKEIRLSIVSFGCGPGTYAVALVHFLRQPEQLPRLFPGVDVSFAVILVDATSKWQRSAEAAVRAVLKADDTVRFLRGSWEDEAVVTAAVSHSQLRKFMCTKLHIINYYFGEGFLVVHIHLFAATVAQRLCFNTALLETLRRFKLGTYCSSACARVQI
jgi:hypothetical protein